MLREIVYAEFKDEEALLSAVHNLKKEKIEIQDAFTPFPIHGLDEVLGFKRSRLPIVCFIAGAIGCLSSLYFQMWTSAVDWPINVGGKPLTSILAFIPVTFEVTVLLAGLTSVFVFFLRSKLFPGKKVKTPALNITDNGFWLAIVYQAAKIDFISLEKLLKQNGGNKVYIGEENL